MARASTAVRLWFIRSDLSAPILRGWDEGALLKLHSSKNCREIQFIFPDIPVMKKCRVQNPDILHAGRGARRGGAGQIGPPTEYFAQGTSAPRTPQGIEDTDTSPEPLSRSMDKRNPI